MPLDLPSARRLYRGIYLAYEIFLKALELRKQKKRKEKTDKYDVPFPVGKTLSSSFLESDKENSKYLLQLTKSLGFDCRPDTPLVVYKEDKYVSLSQSNCYRWNDSYKNRSIIRHYGSYKKTYRYIKLNKETNKFEYYGEVKKTKDSIISIDLKYALMESPTNTIENENYQPNFLSYEQTKWLMHDSIGKVMKHNNIALKEYEYSEILAIDIDTHDADNFNNRKPITQYKNISLEILKILKSLKMTVVLFERSKSSRGIHAYIKLKNIHNKEIIKDELKTYLEQKFPIIKVEYRTKTKSLRLPFSWDYEFVDLTTLKPVKLFKKKLEGTLKELKKEVSIDNDDLIKNIKESIKTEFPPISPHTYTYDHKESIFKKRETIKIEKPFIEKQFSITKGNRIGGDGILWDIAFYSIRIGYSLSQFIDLVERSNQSSSDLSSWSIDKKYKELKSVYDFATRHYTSKESINPKSPPISPHTNSTKDEIGTHSNRPIEFISNIGLLSKEQLDNINIFIDRLYYDKLNKEGESKWLKHTIDDCRLVFPEFIGKMLFEDIYPRKLKGSHTFNLTNTKKQDLLVGYQFPKEYLIALKSKYSLNRDIKVLFDLFKECFLLIYKHKSNPKTYYVPSLCSSTQYIKKGTLIDFYILTALYKNALISKEVDLDFGYNSYDLDSIPKHTLLCDRVFDFSRLGNRVRDG